MIGKLRDWLPRGNTLDPETFHKRHLLICWILGLHVPALFVFGVVQGFGVGTSAIEMITPVASLVLARVVQNRRFAAFFATAGLVFCSSALVHLSGGMIEAHFHFFILIGIIALYQDWVPFAWNAVFTVLSHGLGSGLAADSMFNHRAGQNSPWVWATIHGVAVLAGCVGVVVFWKSTENVQNRNNKLLADLGATELAAAQGEARQRQTMSDLLVNLARRNQSLLNRQLALIAELEQREREPESLSDLFQLDHLATRIRRNAESLLVLSGDDPPRLWGRPMPLSEVVRAAAAEVEDYGRVDVLVNDHIEVSGRAVADLAHLLAELIENATTFSPPGSAVRVRSHVAPTNWSSYLVSIEDTGIGMSDGDLDAANEMLVEPREVDMRRSTLGFHVVSRLAKRYGIEVRVASTPGGGLTALVTLPDDLVAERGDGAAPAPTPSPAAAAPTPPVPAAIPAPAELPAAPAGNGAPAPIPARVGPPLPRRRPATPVAPLAASLSTPPVAPPTAPAVPHTAPAAPPAVPHTAPVATPTAPAAPGALTPADVGALAAFRSPVPPPPAPSEPPAQPAPPAGAPAFADGSGRPPVPAAPTVRSGERPAGTIWPSSLSSSDSLPVGAPPPSLTPMPPPEPRVAPAPPVATEPPLAPGVAPTPPLLARGGGNLFERSQPTSPSARSRRVDPSGPADQDDTPVPSLTRPFVPPPRVLPAGADDLLPIPGLGPKPAEPAEAAVTAEVEREAGAPADEVEGPVPGDEAEALVTGDEVPSDPAVAGEETADGAAEPEAEAPADEPEADEPERATSPPAADREVSAEARVGDADGRDHEGSRDALDTGTMAIIQGLDDTDAEGPASRPGPPVPVAATPDNGATVGNGSTGTAAPGAQVAAEAQVAAGADAQVAAGAGAEAPAARSDRDDDTAEGGDTPEAPADQPPPVTADGLVRRVPGAGLAPSLRREPGRPVPRDIRDVNADPRPADALDREAVRSMLSQFQASQRAGRAIADSPVDLRPPEEDT